MRWRSTWVSLIGRVGGAHAISSSPAAAKDLAEVCPDRPGLTRCRHHLPALLDQPLDRSPHVLKQGGIGHRKQQNAVGSRDRIQPRQFISPRLEVAINLHLLGGRRLLDRTPIQLAQVNQPFPMQRLLKRLRHRQKSVGSCGKLPGRWLRSGLLCRSDRTIGNQALAGPHRSTGCRVSCKTWRKIAWALRVEAIAQPAHANVLVAP